MVRLSCKDSCQLSSWSLNFVLQEKIQLKIMVAFLQNGKKIQVDTNSLEIFPINYEINNMSAITASGDSNVWLNWNITSRGSRCCQVLVYQCQRQFLVVLWLDTFYEYSQVWYRITQEVLEQKLTALFSRFCSRTEQGGVNR